MGLAHAGTRSLVTRGWSRRRTDLIGLFVGLVVFVAAAAVAAQGLVAGEKVLFVAVNSLPNALYYLFWPFMQYGVFLTIPVLIVIALTLRRVRLAAAMAIAGIGVYLLARIVKELVKAWTTRGADRRRRGPRDLRRRKSRVPLRPCPLPPP